MKRLCLRRLGVALAALLLGGAVFYGWRAAQPRGPGAGSVSGNGRVEAVEIDIASRQAGRIAEILVDEGDLVRGGQVVARMDLQSLQAQRAESVVRGAAGT